MAGQSQSTVTTEHETIRAWAEEHDATPATVRGTQGGDAPGVLTLDVEGYGAGEEQLEHISWDAWFEKFESSELAFLYQEEKASGEDSTFFKLIGRDESDAG